MRVARGFRTVGSRRPIRYSDTIPIGMLTKKIQCQLSVSVRIPPRAGPMMKAMPNTAPNRPWYLPRSAGVNRSPMTARATGKIEPAPMPWRPRNRMSCVIVWLRPDSAEPTRKIPIPIMKIGLRP